MPIRYLSADAIKVIHDLIMKRMGEQAAVLYKGGLEFCADEVRDIAYDVPEEEALALKAAYYLWCLTVNHPFADGNKRTAFEVGEVFLKSNGFSLTGISPVEAVSVMSGIATGEFPREEILLWIRKHLSPL
jgi:death-on-curing protein